MAEATTSKNNRFMLIIVAVLVLLCICCFCGLTIAAVKKVNEQKNYIPEEYSHVLNIEYGQEITYNTRSGERLEIELRSNPGSASGNLVTITKEDGTQEEFIVCGNLYWKDSDETELVYMVPDDIGGYFRCNAPLSGKFVEKVIRF